MKFARNVQFHIKNGKEKEFTTLFENEIIPKLKKQGGFREELTLVNKSGAVAISVWEDRKSAEAYETATYPGVLTTLGPMIEGTPKVDMYDVTTRTLQG
jgi:heme-degrading monooxygenase HmoA